jgi:acetyl-CoA C-acetyltransferase
MTQLRRVAIIGGNRIPFARSNGPYATASNQAMFTAALEGLIERYNLHGVRMGEVAAGALLKYLRDYGLTRECVLGSRLSPMTPAYDIQQACGTGLAASTPPRTCRSGSTKACARSSCRPTAPEAPLTN